MSHVHVLGWPEKASVPDYLGRPRLGPDSNHQIGVGHGQQNVDIRAILIPSSAGLTRLHIEDHGGSR